MNIRSYFDFNYWFCPKLFSRISRNEDRPAMYGEAPFSYLEQSARREAQDIRDFLEKALQHYPRSERRDLKKRIQLENVTQSRSAVFELILHEILLTLGCKIKVHPKLNNGSKKRPDFLVKTKNGNLFYLEAVMALDYSDDESSFEKEKKRLINDINNKFSKTDYATLFISVIKQSSKTPSKRSLYFEIQSKLDAIKQDKCNDICWRWESEAGDWCIDFQLLKKRTCSLGRFISSYSFGGVVDVNNAVTGAFSKKATRYGKLDYPYVLAINIDALHLSKGNEMDALFGNEEFIFMKNGEILWGRKGNGAWINEYGPQNTRVSGAWLFDNLTEWRLNNRHILYLNHRAEKTLPEDFYLQLPYARVIDEKMQWVEGANISQILGLQWKWLEY